MPDGPVQLDWHAAPGAILAGRARSGRATVVCVSGAVGSGKSTLANRLIDSDGGVLISTDDYLPEYHVTPEHVRDEPGSSHLHELAHHAGELVAGRSADIPTWSFHEHRRTGSRRVEPHGLIVIEGIHALHRSLDSVRSVGVLVEADRATRWARWEILESTGQRGWGVARARAYFDAVADPTFAKFRDDYADRADFVVTNHTGLPRAD